ncbi:MAG TPA: LysR family transcriptional regulator [Ideonella sp.]|uniref:LysR family transcriptional regulator n=1 Tax=Ideonella sp. TaxID=1929293 RepID=UPI002B84D6AD|nr:LysR family transcriptional regulator [Ideonella sp.]HSI48699.1 LysR family transcriptional regulator [Ideonella sp.]
MDELRALSTFVRAAELGSFNQAALAQGSSPQAVSKTVRQLEQHLGVRLFHRTTRKSALTEEGQRLFDAVRGNLDGLAAALAQARNAVRDDEGLIRVSAGGAVGRKVLVPLLAAFCELHPAIEFDLLLEDGLTDSVSERIDVGFRAGSEPSAQVIARRLFTIQQIVCASPAYLAQHGAPKKPTDLLQHRCTGYRQPGTGRPFLWEFSVKGETVFETVPAMLCSNDPEAEMRAVVAGLGIGQIDSINAAAPIRAGQLVPLLTGQLSERMGLYLYYAQRTQMPGRVRRFIDFAVDRLKDSTDFNLPLAELKSRSKRGTQ